MCFLIQPIVTVHTAKSSTVKQTEKEGKLSTEFDVFLQQSVEMEKEKEVNVETLGLLSRLFSIVAITQPSVMINSSPELTENIENNHFLPIVSPSTVEQEQILQQDPLPVAIAEAEQILLQANEANPLNSSQLDESQGEVSMDAVVNKLKNPVQTVLEDGMDTESNEQVTKVISVENTSMINVQVQENPIINSFQNQTQQNSIESEAKTVYSTPINANQFDQEIVKFVESAIRVQDLGDGLEAAFSLKPEHLGKVDVKVSIVDGNVTAEFFTNTQAGKDLLESHVQTLRLALETQGFQVEKINISQQQNAASFLGSFSQKGESNGRFTQQDTKKRQIQNVQNQETEYRDFDLDTGSQINTTA